MNWVFVLRLERHMSAGCDVGFEKLKLKVTKNNDVPERPSPCKDLKDPRGCHLSLVKSTMMHFINTNCCRRSTAKAWRSQQVKMNQWLTGRNCLRMNCMTKEGAIHIIWQHTVKNDSSINVLAMSQLTATASCYMMTLWWNLDSWEKHRKQSGQTLSCCLTHSSSEPMNSLSQYFEHVWEEKSHCRWHQTLH